MAYHIQPTEMHYMEVYIDGAKQPALIPTGGSLPAKWLIRQNHITDLPDEERGAAWFEFFYDLFREYLGAVVDLMTSEQLNQLAEAWGSETTEQDGAEPGE